MSLNPVTTGLSIEEDLLDIDTIGAACGELWVIEMRLNNQAKAAYAMHGDKNLLAWDHVAAHTVALAETYRRCAQQIVEVWAGRVPEARADQFWDLVARANRAALAALNAVGA